MAFNFSFDRNFYTWNTDDSPLSLRYSFELIRTEIKLLEDVSDELNKAGKRFLRPTMSFYSLPLINRQKPLIAFSNDSMDFFLTKLC